MLLMENITVTIAPIRETLHIRWLSKYWLSFVIIFPELLFLWNNLKVLIRMTRCGAHIHFVRIDYFCFFFKIEWFTVFQNDSFFKFVAEVLLISRCQSFRVWIPYKFISASCLPSALVPLDRWTLNCVRFVHAFRNTQWPWSICLVTVPISNSLTKQ